MVSPRTEKECSSQWSSGSSDEKKGVHCNSLSSPPRGADPNHEIMIHVDSWRGCRLSRLSFFFETNISDSGCGAVAFSEDGSSQYIRYRWYRASACTLNNSSSIKHQEQSCNISRIRISNFLCSSSITTRSVPNKTILKCWTFPCKVSLPCWVLSDGS